jgi:hypothetical protein
MSARILSLVKFRAMSLCRILPLSCARKSVPPDEVGKRNSFVVAVILIEEPSLYADSFFHECLLP